MNITNVLLVGSGGFLGAILRYMVIMFVPKVYVGIFPVATLIVNVVGSFLILFLGEILLEKFGDGFKSFIFVGLLGGFTTFSTFSNETFRLFMDSNITLAITNITLNLALCLFGALLGLYLAKILY